MSDKILLDLESLHAAALAEANQTEDFDVSEAAWNFADALLPAVTAYRAETPAGLAAKLRVVKRLEDGDIALLIEGGSDDERALVVSILEDVARLSQWNPESKENRVFCAT